VTGCGRPLLRCRVLLNILAKLILGRRRTGVPGLFDRRRQGGVGGTVNAHRDASALGTIATIAAPFVIRKLMERRAQRAEVV
jgi:hypothetical protein